MRTARRSRQSILVRYAQIVHPLVNRGNGLVEGAFQEREMVVLPVMMSHVIVRVMKRAMPHVL